LVSAIQTYITKISSSLTFTAPAFIDAGMINTHVENNNENTALMNPPVSLAPMDASFYNPILPMAGAYPPVNPGFLPQMVPLNSDGSSACSPGLSNVVSTDSGLQKLNSTHSISSLNSVSPCSFTAMPMNFQASSPLLPQPAASPYNLVAPAQCNFFSPVQVSPRFTTPSASPQPPMVDHSTVYISPSPLLLTPQQSTSSINSDSTQDIPNVFLTGNTFTLLPPSQSFTASRTPERFVPTHISPAQSPQIPERTTTQIGFRERPMSQSDQQHRTGYPPAKPTSSYQSEVMPKSEPVQSGKRQKKFGYRSKQRKIDRTHRNIQEKFSALGIFAKERELVRGDDTLRIHVKTFEGLTDIQTALNEIQNHKEIDICKVAAVFSKKNRFQKKGFIVYLKVGSVAQVDTCLRLLKRYSKSLRNIAIARSKCSAKEPTDVQNSAIPVQASEGTIEDFVPEVHIPRRLSATAM